MLLVRLGGTKRSTCKAVVDQEACGEGRNPLVAVRDGRNPLEAVGDDRVKAEGLWRLAAGAKAEALCRLAVKVNARNNWKPAAGA